jgi:anti-sigma factor RsiW
MQHLEEGTIHAWLDGELSADEAAAAEAHVRECAQCSAAVAEARGLIAASTRILTALDDVPSRVIPEAPPKRHWYDRTDIRAAAAVLLVAGASMIVVKSRDAEMALKSVAVQDRAATVASPVESSVTADTAAVNQTPQQNSPVAPAVGIAPQSENAVRRFNAK